MQRRAESSGGRQFKVWPNFGSKMAKENTRQDIFSQPGPHERDVHVTFSYFMLAWYESEVKSAVVSFIVNFGAILILSSCIANRRQSATVDLWVSSIDHL